MFREKIAYKEIKLYLLRKYTSENKYEKSVGEFSDKSIELCWKFEHNDKSTD